MSNRTEAQDYKIATNCELDAETRANLLKHLEEHGPASLLTSNKFSQYAGCFPEEITRAIAAETATPIAPTAADDLIGKQEAPPTPADVTTESPAAMRLRLQATSWTYSKRLPL